MGDIKPLFAPEVILFPLQGAGLSNGVNPHFQKVHNLCILGAIRDGWKFCQLFKC